MEIVDKRLNNITMYRLVLYLLIGLVLVASLLGFLGFIHYGGLNILFSVVFLVVLGVGVNYVFARAFDAILNVESVYISALILSLIIAPVSSLSDLSFYFWAIVWTVASKFIFAVNKKHFFNPVALAVFLTSLFLGNSANWWVGNTAMLPFVSAAAFLVIRKTQRGVMTAAFFVITGLVTAAAGLFAGAGIADSFIKVFFHSPALFFTGFMLTEPLTTPPSRQLRVVYGALTGLLFAPQIHVGSFYTTPESALLLANIFSYVVSPKEKLALTLKEKIKVAPDIIDFIFKKTKNFSYKAGQYMEWTLSYPKSDSRGNRRYLTLASSPSEDELRVGVKFHEKSSTFKKKLITLAPGEKILAGQLAGDFVLPKDEKLKLAFIAGGIGVTPFRSMIKEMVDEGRPRDVVFLYSVKNQGELVYKSIFDEAKRKFGIRIYYFVSHPDGGNIYRDFYAGRVDEKIVQNAIPDFRERIFYISGPRAMVTYYKKTLSLLGVEKGKIKSDFFPGFA
jgi:ferredoxin-NADP reductase/Na+-translocating ferredoxin:NAD+ oxidoreductase RnfD subunit